MSSTGVKMGRMTDRKVAKRNQTNAKRTPDKLTIIWGRETGFQPSDPAGRCTGKARDWASLEVPHMFLQGKVKWGQS